MRGQSKRLLYAGTYERDCPRNELTIAALQRAGFDVRELHAAVWERDRDKSGRFLRPGSLIRLGLRLGVAYISTGVRLLRELSDSDAVVIGYIGQADMLVLAPLAKLAGRPVVFNPLVTLTDTLVEDRRLARRGGLAAMAIAVVDRLALRLADAILVDTPENGDYLVRRFGIPANRIHQVDVGADEDLFQGGPHPPPHPQFWERGEHGKAQSPLPKLGVGAKPTLRVLFYGKFTPLHGIDTILQAAKLLEDQEDIRFEVIGSGQLSAEMNALAAKLDLRNVDFIPWVPFEWLPERIAAADIFLGIFGDTAKAARVIPNKVFQGMAMGAAIVTRDSPAIQRVLSDGGSALLVPPADPTALAGAVLRMRDPALRDNLSRGSRLAFEKTGSLDALAERLTAIIEAVVPVQRSGILAGSRR
ncbi:MAG TPA: glycosyltransferase family 4 protein [Nitrolancea sp.]|nr:glycosyltransferase family 4 protein [Nitrolancea sp.]